MKELDETGRLTGTYPRQASSQELPTLPVQALESRQERAPMAGGPPGSPVTFVTAVGTAPASRAASAVPSSAPTSRVASRSTSKSGKL